MVNYNSTSVLKMHKGTIFKDCKCFVSDEAPSFEPQMITFLSSPIEFEMRKSFNVELMSCKVSHI